MLVMPILNTSKNGVTKIYNVEVKLKTANKVKEQTIINGYDEGDIIVSSSSFNHSLFNTKHKEGHVVTNFIRQSNYRKNKKDFLVTSRKSVSSPYYDLYHVEMPPQKVTQGLDNLYGQAIIDLQKQIPGIPKGRYINLRDLGVDNHITEDKLARLKSVVEKAANKTELDFLTQANNITTLPKTLDFIKLFDFHIIGESTILESQIKDILNSLEPLHTRDTRNLEKYYEIAKDNKDVYKTLTYMNQILTGNTLNLIQKQEKSKILVKSSDTSKGRENERKAA